MLARLRPLYNQIVLPIGRISIRLGFTPDFWTLSSLVLAGVAGVFLTLGKFWWGLTFAVLMYIADMLDGATARAGGTSSAFGTVFDHVIDRYAETIIIGGLLLGDWISPAAAIFSISGMIMASYVRAKAESAGGLDECTVGIAGRAEKLLPIYVTIVLLGVKVSGIPEYILWFVGLISHITAVQRLLYTRARIPRKKAVNS